MTNKEQKLELTWIGKENRPKPEPRILLEDPMTTYYAPNEVRTHDIINSLSIFAVNVLALHSVSLPLLSTFGWEKLA